MGCGSHSLSCPRSKLAGGRAGRASWSGSKPVLTATPPGCAALGVDSHLLQEKTCALLCSFSLCCKKHGTIPDLILTDMFLELLKASVYWFVILTNWVLKQSSLPVSPKHAYNQTSQSSHRPMEIFSSESFSCSPAGEVAVGQGPGHSVMGA